MNRLLYKIITAFTLLLMLASCEKNDVPVFDSNYSALNIWFGSSAMVQDQTTYNYSYSLSEDSLLFQARVTGLATDHDRSFTLEAYDGDLAEAEGSFYTKTYVIKAGEISGEFPIYFDSSKLKDKIFFTDEDGELFFRVKANDLFAPGANTMQTLHVVLKNYLAKPSEWDIATYPHLPYKNYFGSYSRVKYSFMIQVTGLVDFHIVSNTTVPYDKEKNNISVSYVNFLLSKVKQALEEYNESHAEDLTDENGSVVVF